MFKKILIVEDQESIEKGLQVILKEKTKAEIQTSNYCDDALLKIKASLVNNATFDLLITDLSFQEDYLDNHIKTGERLISQVKKLQPNLKIIVFSIESSIGKINKLINEYSVNAFVSKGREEITEVINAIKAVSQNENYYSESVKKMLRSYDNISDVTKTDTLVLKLLANGLKQNKLPEYLKKHNIPSSSKRAIEYRIDRLKTILNAETIPHLISVAKDIGLI